MRTVLLTGGTGFLGGHVARSLAREGWRVRALVRDVSRAGELGAAGAEICPGNVCASDDLSPVCENCEAIVHVAGLVKARTLEEYRQVNLHGTERLLRSAVRAAPDALFLYVSSQAAVGPAVDGRPVTENDPPRPVSWYGLSKREGEQAVDRLWPGAWIVLRPGVLYGPGDRGLLLMFRAAARGMLPVPAATRRIQILAAEDAALGIARAAERRDLAGRCGFLCDPTPIAIGELCRALSRLPPRTARLLPLPDFVVRIAGAMETLAESVTGRSLAFNADKTREILAGDWLCDPSPMLRDLAFPPPTSLEDGLRKTWNWYVSCGWLNL